jgi:putative transposase
MYYGPEFVSEVLDRGAYEQRVQLAFCRPEKPTDNAHIEAFNGRLRQECLNQHWFLSLADAHTKIEAWRIAYNESRPHGALEWATPAEFALRCREIPLIQGSRKSLLSRSCKSGTGSPVEQALLRCRTKPGSRSADAHLQTLHCALRAFNGAAGKGTRIE